MLNVALRRQDFAPSSNHKQINYNTMNNMQFPSTNKKAIILIYNFIYVLNYGQLMIIILTKEWKLFFIQHSQKSKCVKCATSRCGFIHLSWHAGPASRTAWYSTVSFLVILYKFWWACMMHLTLNKQTTIYLRNSIFWITALCSLQDRY